MTQKLAIIHDYPEEQWHSMDLCAEMLTQQLQQKHAHHFQVQALCPPFRLRFPKIPGIDRKNFAFNGDRLLNRFWDYPHFLQRQVKRFDLFHIADHSYAQLVHELPADRTGVFCHDLDTFRCLLEPKVEPRPAWFRAMARRILAGLQKASVVFYSTSSIRKQMENYEIINPRKLIYCPYGISDEFSPLDSPLSHQEQVLITPVGSQPFLLHVGTCISRKRIDILLNVFAKTRQKFPELNLVKVGGSWSKEQRQQINELHLEHAIIHLQNLPRTAIAHLYRRAALVLLTSESEGFGLPVIEALACGAMIVASDISVLREVGGDAIYYCSIDEISNWVNTLEMLLINPNLYPDLGVRLNQSQKYSWSNHANIIAQTYFNLDQFLNENCFY